MIGLKQLKMMVLALGIGLTEESEATLIAESIDGVNVVYDSIHDITWTADATLFDTMLKKEIASGGGNNLIQDIINANNGYIADLPNFSDNGLYKLSASDLLANGTVDWWGAMAFAKYLNTIHYGNATQWALPDDSLLDFGPGGLGMVSPGTTNKVPYTSSLSFENSVFFWSSTEKIWPDRGYLQAAGSLLAVDGGTISNFKWGTGYAWAMTPGNISGAVATVPVPASIWGFIIGLSLMKILSELNIQDRALQTVISWDTGGTV